MPPGRPKLPRKESALSEQDERRYRNLVSLLHSLTYALTDRFLKDKDEESREKIVNDLSYYAGLLLNVDGGCGDPQLCYNKETGCTPCDGQPSKKL